MYISVGIIGYGWVGKAMKTLFPDAGIYDPYLGYESESVFNSQVIFICVPTPFKDGKLDCSIVEESVKKCDPKSLVVIRSTVNAGFCNSLDRDVLIQPEYLGETVGHPLADEKKRGFLVIGGKPELRRKLIEVYQNVYNANITIHQVSCLEAEVIKLSENRAIAFKVAQAQELYDACEKNGVDYYTIRDIVYGTDPRFNLWFTFVYPDKRGFKSKCIPKDVYAWSDWAKTPLTKEVLKYNETFLHNS